MLHTGQRISEYVLDERLGSGGAGEVWRAHHHVWQQQFVAIKIPRDADYIRQLQREGLAIQQLDHPNIIKAHGLDPYADPPYLVMEYAAGGSLRSLIKSSKPDVRRAIALVRQVLEGLAYAHSKGLIHRDVKPENILLTADGTVKLGDFGLGKRIQSGQSIVHTLSIDGAVAGEVAGTIDYMSPEQRGGGDVDARSDLYATGVVLFELLTGDRPAGTEVPSDLNGDVPKSLDDVFRQAYARVDRRFRSAADFLKALDPPQPPALVPKAGKSPGGMRPCPRCQRPIGDRDQFCMHCGVQLATVIRRCGHCGAYPDPIDDFCVQCGRTLTQLKLIG